MTVTACGHRHCCYKQTVSETQTGIGTGNILVGFEPESLIYNQLRGQKPTCSIYFFAGINVRIKSPKAANAARKKPNSNVSAMPPASITKNINTISRPEDKPFIHFLGNTRL